MKIITLEQAYKQWEYSYYHLEFGTYCDHLKIRNYIIY